MGRDRIAAVALLRELVEEIGLTPDKNGKMISVSKEIRSLVCSDKNNWLKIIENRDVNIKSLETKVISEENTSFRTY